MLFLSFESKRPEHNVSDNILHKMLVHETNRTPRNLNIRLYSSSGLLFIRSEITISSLSLQTRSIYFNNWQEQAYISIPVRENFKKTIDLVHIKPFLNVMILRSTKDTNLPHHSGIILYMQIHILSTFIHRLKWRTEPVPSSLLTHSLNERSSNFRLTYFPHTNG